MDGRVLPASAAAGNDAVLLGSRASVPHHVVYRAFPTETVVLNLETGKYHGLNPTAGEMLDALAGAASLHDAVLALAADYEQRREVVERDLCELCRALLERGLIELKAV
jgi:Coenzyme PQQ synthesis protein D (PqqD)